VGGFILVQLSGIDLDVSEICEKINDEENKRSNRNNFMHFLFGFRVLFMDAYPLNL